MKKIKLRIQQKEALPLLLKDLWERGKALLVMATGLGKTMTSALVGKEVCADTGRILFLAHTNEILRQTMAEDYAIFFNPEEMGLFNGENRDYKKRIVFATFQTMRNSLHLFSPRDFLLIDVDESHHSEAESYAKVLEYFEGYMLGMTATPNRKDRKDIRRFFGDESYNLPLPTALARGLLPKINYEFVTDGGIDKEKLEAIKRRLALGDRKISIKDLNRSLFLKTRDERIVEILERKRKKTIIFAPNIRYAEHVCNLLPQAETYHSGNSTEDNKAVLDRLKTGKISYVIAVDALNEGVSVPKVARVVFLRSTTSETIYLQQLGRALHSGLESIEVLDFVGNMQRLQMGSALVQRVRDEMEKYQTGGTGKSTLVVETPHLQFHFASELVDILQIVQRLGGEFYSYEEARQRVQQFGIKSSSDYEIRYREDLRLPRHPPRNYKEEWKSWNSFLERNSFYSYAEAKAKVKELGVKSSHSYITEHKKDLRLPSTPSITYSNEWKSWDDFLEKDPPYSYSEAKRRVREFGIRSQRDYWSGYKKDLRLPSNPPRFYANQWQGWSKFFGK
jgi:superfamily II DNA or RNA helicase